MSQNNTRNRSFALKRVGKLNAMPNCVVEARALENFENNLDATSKI